jgi:periplasmic protein TonB
MHRPWFQIASPLLAHQRTVWGLCLCAILAACASKGEPPKPPPPAAAVPPAPVAVAPALPQPTLTSQAVTPRDYRRDAASHLYSHNTNRIYQGKMPPLLYAVGVLQVEIDRMGQVTGIHWMRAPTQAPEVMAEIERSVRLAAPYPAPVRMGRVTYTDTWLWHKSGRFQLDTLTEGQY